MKKKTMEAEKELLMGIPAENIRNLEYDLEKIMITKEFPKSTAHSKRTLESGNILFRNKYRDFTTYRDIFRYYNEGILRAPLESEVLAQAYYNRSALLLYIRKYEDCIKDIDRTLKFTKSDVLTVKLLCRKVECIKKMGSSNYQSVLDAAENYAVKLDKKDKAQVHQAINKAKICRVSNDEASRNRSNQSDIVLPQLDDTLNCISIEHNEKWGRHLVARKNYEPGNLIFIENIYVTLLNPDKKYTNCNYCLKICWSGIACDHCSWAMFCDEVCKKKAWDTYHDVECSVIPHLINTIPKHKARLDLSLRMLLVGLREARSIANLKAEFKMVDQCTDVPYKGFYKNGRFTNCAICSVYSLKSKAFDQSTLFYHAQASLFTLVVIVQHSRLINNFKFEKVDNILANEDLVFLDVCYKGLFKNGRFISCSIRSVYSLKAREFCQLQLHSLAVTTLLVLIAIIQNNRLIRNVEFKNIDDILANEDLVFLGSLLIKFTAINPENCHRFTQNCMCKRLKSADEECCSRGACLASLSSLVNHSCNPNACLSFSEDKKITFYALRTIKKNSQIFITYAGSYYDQPLKDRKKKLDHYKFTCKCEACDASWPVTNIMSSALPPPCDLERMHCQDICAALDAKKLNFNKKDFNLKQKEKLCETITKVERLLIPNRPKPNVLSTILERALKELYMRFYGWIPPIVAFQQCDKS